MGRPQAPSVGIQRFERGVWTAVDDSLAAEEPLELLLGGEPLSVIMRTPGDDLELALGLLLAERVIAGLDDVTGVRISAEAGEGEIAAGSGAGVPVAGDLLESNQIDVAVRGGRRRPRRSFVQSSACGVCGATTVESLALDFAAPAPGPDLDPALPDRLPGALREGQRLFSRTGGLHASGLFDAEGRLLVLREDVGRHNALDKVVGRRLLDGALPAAGTVLAVSGRAGYEIVQKAVAAGIPAIVAVGAPSSLAVQVARRFGVTLVGFARSGRFNVYSGWERFGQPGR